MKLVSSLDISLSLAKTGQNVISINEMEAHVIAIFSFHSMQHAFGFMPGSEKDDKEELSMACLSLGRPV